MIPRYSDLAANERTYLAWMRTSLAIIAFGFLMERFDLVLRTFALSLGDGTIKLPPGIGREAGVVLVALGLVVMIFSTIRFIKTTRLLKSDGEEAYSIGGVLVVGGSFILLSLFVLLYVTKILF